MYQTIIEKENLIEIERQKLAQMIQSLGQDQMQLNQAEISHQVMQENLKSVRQAIVTVGSSITHLNMNVFELNAVVYGLKNVNSSTLQSSLAQKDMEKIMEQITSLQQQYYVALCHYGDMLVQITNTQQSIDKLNKSIIKQNEMIGKQQYIVSTLQLNNASTSNHVENTNGLAGWGNAQHNPFETKDDFSQGQSNNKRNKQ